MFGMSDASARSNTALMKSSHVMPEMDTETVTRGERVGLGEGKGDGAAVVGESSAVEGWAVGGESWRLLAAWADDTIMASIELPTACACGCACGCCGGGS